MLNCYWIVVRDAMVNMVAEAIVRRAGYGSLGMLQEMVQRWQSSGATAYEKGTL